MSHSSQANAQWWVNDQTPDNPYGKSTDYDAFLDYLGALPRSLTPAIAQGTLRVNVYELNDHPDYKAAVIGALEQWSSVTPLKFEVVDDAAYDSATDWIKVVSPEVGEEDDGTAYSNNRYVNIGQRFHDTEPNKTVPGGYVFDSFIHEFGHEFGLNHPGLYNYSGPGGVQINYLNNATWTYDRQQYSVMSYFDGIDVGEESRWSATTPMQADIEAVIRHYFSTVDSVTGVRTYQHIDLNTGDNVYGFNSGEFGYQLTTSGPQHDIGFVIHDTGGNDAIDFSLSTAATVLDLRPGYFSSVNGHHNNVSIFAGHNVDASDYLIETGIGSQFDDVLIGNDGANTLDGAGGGDSMAGNAGDDTYYVNSKRDIVRELAGGGDDTIIVLNSNVKLKSVANVEHILYANGAAGLAGTGAAAMLNAAAAAALAPVLTGDNGNNTLDGGAGDDVIFGLKGDDLLIGGRDSLASRDINNTIDIADLADQTESDDGNDRLFGGKGNDTLFGGQGDDTLEGGDGDDVMHGQAGVDVFRGGKGVDTVDYSKESPFQLLVNLETNTASGGTGSGDTFDSIENLIGSDDRIDRFIGTDDDNHFWGQGGGDYFNGRGGDDILDGGNDGDIIYGEEGNDTIIGGAAQDYLNGGKGTDTVVYSGSTDGVTIDLLNGTAIGGDGDGEVQIVGRGATIKHDILVGFENAIGSAFADHLIGNSKANVLTGGAGDDTLTGGGARDTLKGGAGIDTADYADATKGVKAFLNSSFFSPDQYKSIENLAGSAHDDLLSGDNDDNVLTGQGGRDTIYGLRGNDTLLGDFAPQGDAPPQPGLGTGYATLAADATNNSIATAFDISNNFSLAADPDIFDSTTVLHSTVNATGNGQGGFYKVTLAAGTIITIDIDHTADPDVHDSIVRLVDANGAVLAQNDDAGNDPGSSHGRDSSLVYVVQETGSYYIVEGRWNEDLPGDGWDESVPPGSTYELNVSVEFPPAPSVPGTAGRDDLDGGRGNDLLDGGLGRDTLTGGSDDDSFRFSTALGNGNVDRITDFKVSEDTIVLDSTVFASAGAVGTLAVGAFHSSKAGVAHDADDRIIYDKNDGYLSYDADGSDVGAAVRFARLSPHLNLHSTDFVIV